MDRLVDQIGEALSGRFTVHFGSHASLFDRGRLVFWSMIAASFALPFIVSVALSAATTGVEAKPSDQIVSRTHKGNRLRLPRALQPNSPSRDLRAPKVPAWEDLNLPEGCDAPVSPIANERAARVASYCVS